MVVQAVRSRFSRKIAESLRMSEEKYDGDYNSCWCPRTSAVFNILLSARITAVFMSNISDCDETFNYWEPTHYLIYGSGLQTWEYSPKYALRSYAYLLLHALPAQFIKQLFHANKITVFYYIRFLLGILCATCETYFFKSLAFQFGNHTARLYFVFAAFNTGMFISSVAYLPSSFAMYTCLLAFGGWFNRNYPVAIFGIALGTLLGWPFFALLGVPIAYDMVIRQRRVFLFIKWAAGIFAAIMIPLVAIDTHFYGNQVIAPLNIVLYNVFGKGGPELYGMEPWTFYFKNCFLNFNVLFPVALLSLPICLIVEKITKSSKDVLNLPLWLSLSPIYLWIIVFFTRSHKEERFLFPIYPLLLASACAGFAKLQELYHHLFTKHKKQHFSVSSNWLAAIFVLLFGIISMSRYAALFAGYRAPLEIYPELHNMVHPFNENEAPKILEHQRINVCVGKEWYRYPSSFFLPDNWRFLFIKSEFKGQLPQPFAHGVDGTKVIPENMNDMNREEISAYANISECDFMIDTDIRTESENEPNYSLLRKQWEVLRSRKFLHAPKSSAFFRAFYIPFISERYLSYVDYNLLKSKRKRRRTFAYLSEENASHL